MTRFEIVILFLFCCSAAFIGQSNVSIASPLPIDASTVLLMHMDETNGTAVSDASVYGNDGQAVGTTIIDGKFGRARSFNPVINFDNLDHITVQDSLSLDVLGALSITAWIRPDAQNEGGGVFISKWNRFISASYFLGYRSDTKEIDFFVSENGDAIGKRLIADTQIPSDGSEWHHVAAVFSPSNYMKVFVDGVEAGVLTIGIPASIYNSDARLIIGAEDGGSRGGDGGLSTPFTGSIDEVRIDSRALSSEEIRSLVPEPSTLILLSFGLIGLVAWRRRIA